ncbi:hypothetical protein BgiBS90_014218 [Biomphalaria glabrata]|nr:hypothetical protein BgiBS90_014218 [Biomphalaria glabrata]
MLCFMELKSQKYPMQGIAYPTELRSLHDKATATPRLAKVYAYEITVFEQHMTADDKQIQQLAATTHQGRVR